MEFIVILGAAVRPDGRPSPSLERRIAYGAKAAHERKEAPVFCSGAEGPAGPSEASVIAEGLRDKAVAPHRIVIDDESRDTLQTVVAACRFAHRRGLGRAIVCTDSYHAPRTRMLFAVLGLRAVDGPIDDGREGPTWAWRRMQLREWAAYPYDLFIVLLRRRELRAIIRDEG